MRSDLKEKTQHRKQKKTTYHLYSNRGTKSRGDILLIIMINHVYYRWNKAPRTAPYATNKSKRVGSPCRACKYRRPGKALGRVTGSTAESLMVEVDLNTIPTVAFSPLCSIQRFVALFSLCPWECWWLCLCWALWQHGEGWALRRENILRDDLEWNQWAGFDLVVSHWGHQSNGNE